METKNNKYDKYPSIDLGSEFNCHRGWSEIIGEIRRNLPEAESKKTVLVLECYQGVYEQMIASEIREYLDCNLILSKTAFRNSREIENLVFPDVTDDEVFGKITRLQIEQFFDPQKLRRLQEEIKNSNSKLTVNLLYSNCFIIVFYFINLLINSLTPIQM